jgi:hypothetical protein
MAVTPGSESLPPGLVDYLAASDRQRTERVVKNLERFTPREQQLIREAAVMGFVRGNMGARRDEIPPDSDVLYDVLVAIDGMRDLYPLIGNHTCDCCGRNVRTPLHHEAHDDSGDSWDYCQDCNNAGCDLVTCSLIS